MLELNITFAVASFVAGLLMFLAPCTLPLVPAYLAFISGVKQDEVKDNKEATKKDSYKCHCVCSWFLSSFYFIWYSSRILWFVCWSVSGTVVASWRCFYHSIWVNDVKYNQHYSINERPKDCLTKIHYTW